MAEGQEEGSSSGTGSQASDPAAMALALGSASRSEADAFLRRQGALIDDQRHHLHAQLLPSLSEKWLGVFLRVATACVGLAFAGGVAWMVWEARHSDGLKVQPFSVPPAFAERGLTGEVVAARVIDRLSELQTQTNTGRPARSYSNAWGDKAIKLEIPETGVSLEELDSWLRAKLGNETPLTGEVVRGEAGVTLTARTTEGAVSVSGTEAEMDALTGKLAEAIYRLTQPYRYATYLFRHENRPADAAPIFQHLALTGGAEERRWSYNMWAVATQAATGDNALGLRMFQEAHKATPDAGQPYPPLIGGLMNFGRLEEALRLLKARLDMTGAANNPTLRSSLARLTGNYIDALPTDIERARTGVPGQPPSILLSSVVQDQTGMHERSAAQASLADFHPDDGLNEIGARRLELSVAMDGGNWREALAHQGDLDAVLKQNPRNRLFAMTIFAPALALAKAHLGRMAEAERDIAQTPGDCDPCLIARAQIAELGGQRGRAEYWFTRATEAGPSLPFAFEAEGRALLSRGKPDEAIARFTIANQKSPHFADALEGWGEALMAKNQSHLAPAKFAEAEKYAPNWGRLHLKWGEALVYAGRRDEARAQFARAAQLDLSPSEKAELKSEPQQGGR